MPNGAWIVHILSREKLDPKSFHISSTFLCSENCLAFFSYGCQDQFARLHCSNSLASYQLASSYSTKLWLTELKGGLKNYGYIIEGINVFEGTEGTKFIEDTEVTESTEVT